MPLFGGPSERDFLRVEKHLEKIERQLERLNEQQAEHTKRANGHPAKVVWHGMTWPQLIGLLMMVAILVLVGFGDFVLGDVSGNTSALLEVVEVLKENTPTPTNSIAVSLPGIQ